MRIWILILTILMPLAAFAQGAGVSLGGFAYDSSQPVEITADSLDVDQSSGTATFQGNVVIGQSEMRLSAQSVVVEYSDNAEGQSAIDRLLASGGVTLVGPDEAAEASSAVYDVQGGFVELSGNVLVTQGPAALSGDTLRINLETGSGTLQGNVRTILNTGGDQ